MTNILTSLNKTVIAGSILTILFIAYYLSTNGLIDEYFWQFIFRYIHVLAGTMWIGLLWYFNFVQIPNMPKIPDDQKPAIGKVIAPAALWYFRWGAMFTLLSGLILAHLNGYLVSALQLGVSSGSNRDTAIGIGMWMAIIMFINVWFVIWPNQKKALGIVEADADTKAKSARTAMLFSRTNTLLSIPMLFAMVSAQNIWA
ncbi:MAG: urate hydroxylase PuuD [Pseudomonadota bacterium]|nr:urate hydroxylase PuuD [Pseudomonadota bacterium]